MTSDQRPDLDDESGLDARVVGARIRARRNELGLTLQNVAERTNLSKSFLSQVETGKVWPSVGALEQIASELELSTRELIGDKGDHAPPHPAHNGAHPGAEPPLDRRVHVTRQQARKTVTYPGGRHALELLTPDLQRQFEVMLANDDPGDWHDVDRSGSETEEFVLVLDGTYEFELGDETHTVGAGDSIYFTPTSTYRFRSLGDPPARAVWIALPPSF